MYGAKRLHFDHLGQQWERFELRRSGSLFLQLLGFSLSHGYTDTLLVSIHLAERVSFEVDP